MNKLTYIECDKRGYHYGQYVNMVCVDKNCFDNPTCCCACVQEFHKDHQTKPLKLVVKQALEYSKRNKSLNFNAQKLIEKLKANQVSTLESLKTSKQEIQQVFANAEIKVKNYYESLIMQVKRKNCDSKTEIQRALREINSCPTNQKLREIVKNITIFIQPMEEQQNPQLSETDIQHSIQTSQNQLSNSIKHQLNQSKKHIELMIQQIQKKTTTVNIWKDSSFKFSQPFKHQNIKIVSDTIVKSVKFSGYKFAVLQPSLEKINKTTTIFYRINQCTSNWVAVGMCHRKIVQSKSFGFNFGGIGHGGYLVSANGASWSNTDAEMNNTIKSFKFVKGDIIKITIDFQQLKIKFNKKQDNFSLDFKTIQGDELYPCVLFYYINDEVEYLTNIPEVKA